MHLVCPRSYFNEFSVTMKHYLPYLIWVGLSVISIKSFGQISIDYPTDRAVFQRDRNNSATIYISGSYTKVTDRIEADDERIQGVPGPEHRRRDPEDHVLGVLQGERLRHHLADHDVEVRQDRDGDDAA